MGNSTMSMAIFLFFVCLPEANSHEIHHFWCWKSPTDTAPAPFGASAPASSRPPTRRGAGRLGEFTKNAGFFPWEKTWWNPWKNGENMVKNDELWISMLLESCGIPWDLFSYGMDSSEFHRRKICGFQLQTCVRFRPRTKLWNHQVFSWRGWLLPTPKKMCSVIFRFSWESLDLRKTSAGEQLLYSPKLMDRPVNFAFNKCSEKRARFIS